MSIQSDIVELDQLDLEIKRLSKHLRELRQRKKKCEQRILIWLDVNDQPGIKYQGRTIVAQQKCKRKRISKGEKQEHANYILEKHGIYDSGVFNEIMEAMKGETEEEPRLRII